jgi:dTMP kinase
VLEELERWAVAGLKPDRTFLLDVPPAVGLARIAGRDGVRDRMESESLAFFERVRAAYRARAAAEPARFVVVDATRPVDAVAQAVSDSLAALARAWREGPA